MASTGHDIGPWVFEAMPSDDPQITGMLAASRAAGRRARVLASPAVARRLYDASSYGGLVVQHSAVSRGLIHQMWEEARSYYQHGGLSPNGQEADGRRDVVCFLGMKDAAARRMFGLAYGVALLSAVCAELSRLRPKSEKVLQPGKVQLACYSGDGASYPPHLDSYPASELGSMAFYAPESALHEIEVRKLTAVLYLQASPWREACGGHLRAYRTPVDEPTPSSEHVDIEPCGGTMVLFRSRDLCHEVTPTYCQRFALSMWCLELGAGLAQQ